MKNNSYQKSTPKGLTQNWSGLQQQGAQKKVKKGGMSVSRSEEYSRAFLANNTPHTKVKVSPALLDDRPCPKIRIEKNGSVSWVGRKKGKFTRFEISRGLAKNLGII